MNLDQISYAMIHEILDMQPLHAYQTHLQIPRTTDRHISIQLTAYK